MYNRQPYDLDTRLKIVLLYRTKKYTIKDIFGIYGISMASLMRWNRNYNGTESSLMDKTRISKFRTYSLNTRLEVVLLYRTGKYTLKELSIRYGCCVVGSISRWNKKYDGTKNSLLD